MLHVPNDGRHEIPADRSPWRGAPRTLARYVAELWDRRSTETQRATLRRAVDLGLTHFDLVNIT